jgi:hypothetical protein
MGVADEPYLRRQPSAASIQRRRNRSELIRLVLLQVQQSGPGLVWMVTGSVALVLEETIGQPEITELAPDERVPLFVISRIIKPIGGDVDQTGPNQVERRVEERGDGPVKKLALVSELVIQSKVMPRQSSRRVWRTSVDSVLRAERRGGAGYLLSRAQAVARRP